jgi:hypothetical protein
MFLHCASQWLAAVRVNVLQRTQGFTLVSYTISLFKLLVETYCFDFMTANGLHLAAWKTLV